MSHRVARLGEEIRAEVARIVAKELKDPRVGFVTVTRVSLTRDLRHAKVLVSVLGSEAQQEETLAALRRATGFVRRELGRRLRVRHNPELVFQYDPGIEATERVAQLLSEVAVGPSAPEEADGGGEG